MPQLTNEQRAQRARRAVIAYRKAADTNETRPRALLCDLLTDLMHLAAKCQGVNFERSLQMARGHYQAEFLREAMTMTQTEPSKTAVCA